ncbi:MAG TPA: ABC transporter transmembrane domain-containing protein [Blastocatellia bacterium]|nr:ABC transporter transmembrane domain-containing protein [Blastocatellia bacterium]
MRDLFRLLKYVRPYAGRFLLAVFLTVLVGVFETSVRALLAPTLQRLKPPTTTATVPNTTSSTATNPNDLLKAQGLSLERINDLLPAGNTGWYLLVALFPLLALLKGISDYFADYFMGVVGLSAIVRIRQDLYEHILKQSAIFFNQYSTNALTARLVSDVQKLELAVSRWLADLLREFFKLIGYLVLVLFIDWKLTLLIFLVAPVISYVTTLSGRRLRNMGNKQQYSNEDILDIAQETISGNRVVKAFGMEPFESSKFLAASKRLMRASIKAIQTDSLAPSIIELIGYAGIALLFLYVRPKIFSGAMTPDSFFVYCLTLFSLYDPIRKLSRSYNSFQQAFAASSRIFSALDEHTEIVDRPNAAEIGPLKNEIEFRNISFKYQDNSGPVLRGINLSVKAGEVVAIVGVSGSGKTTLTNLLMRYFDLQEGQILIDGIDIRDIKLSNLRKQIGLVTQEVILFNDTVRNNLAYGQPDVSQEQLEAAARAALVHDFVIERPEGYDTQIGERGVQFSGGQRQRLAIARAIMKNAPVLILDEATSSLDTESEAQVQRALSNLLRGKTTIVIAHRLSTIRRADKIVVMEDGNIVEVGKHEELIGKRGVYRRLYDLQFADDDLIAQEVQV